jgi:hypothetical protein
MSEQRVEAYHYKNTKQARSFEVTMTPEVAKAVFKAVHEVFNDMAMKNPDEPLLGDFLDELSEHIPGVEDI